MGKFYLNKLPKRERIKLIGEFYDTVNSLKNREEVRLFFKDLLSPDEIAMLMRRIEVALLVKAGYTYENIKEALGVGMDKITAVQRSLIRGGEGYDVVIKRLRKIIKNREKKARKKEKATMVSFPSLGSLKKKYPFHFLLFNLLDELNDWLDGDGKLQIEQEINGRRGRKRREGN